MRCRFRPDECSSPAFAVGVRADNFIASAVDGRKRARMMTRYFLLMWAVLWVVSWGKAKADQFVLFDVTFTYTKEEADNSKPSKITFLR